MRLLIADKLRGKSLSKVVRPNGRLLTSARFGFSAVSPFDLVDRVMFATGLIITVRFGMPWTCVRRMVL